MRPALQDDQLGVLHELDCRQRRGFDGHDLIVVAMQDERGNADRFQIFRQIRFREGLMQK